MHLVKHLGKRKDSGVRVAIVFMQIPDDPEHCLVVDIDSLMDAVRDDFMEILHSKEAQRAKQLYEILNVKQYHGNQTYLAAFHDSRSMMKLPTSEVIVTLDRETTISLADLNTQLRKINEGTEHVPEEVLAAHRNVQKQKIEIAEKDGVRSMAENIMWQSIDMEEQAKALLADAMRKRKQAEDMMTTIGEPVNKPKPAVIAQNTVNTDAPKKRGRPAKTTSL